MLKLIVLIPSLLFLASCASLWPWGYSRPVEESKSQGEIIRENYKGYEPEVKTSSGVGFFTRVTSWREKGFDYNQDGWISPEERRTFLRMRHVREQEKLLRGERE